MFNAGPLDRAPLGRRGLHRRRCDPAIPHGEGRSVEEARSLPPLGRLREQGRIGQECRHRLPNRIWVYP